MINTPKRQAANKLKKWIPYEKRCRYSPRCLRLADDDNDDDDHDDHDDDYNDDDDNDDDDDNNNTSKCDVTIFEAL